MKSIRSKTGTLCRSSFITLVLAFLVILAGGIVRSTGSGMGCPDWPKCFGNWIPPTHVSQLPEDYKSIYTQKRQEKNNKVAGYLGSIGYTDLAEALRNDPNISEEIEFNATKTWIEYVNRILGVLVGFAVLVTAAISLSLYKAYTKLTITSILAVILVGFQGWLGSVVVSTNLLPWMITLHMIVALIFVAQLIYMWYKAGAYTGAVGGTVGFSISKAVILGLLLLTLVQVAFGTQVREHIDIIARAYSYESRDQWAGQLDTTFYIHRSFSILIFLANAWLCLRLWRSRENNYAKGIALVLMLLLIGEIASGMALYYLDLPASMQPIHLLLGSAIFGIQFYVLLLAGKTKRNESLSRSALQSASF